jgi:hypothetical protein
MVRSEKRPHPTAQDNYGIAGLNAADIMVRSEKRPHPTAQDNYGIAEPNAADIKWCGLKNDRTLRLRTTTELPGSMQRI